MAEQVVTELTIDSAGATAGAAEYSRAMDTAQSAADRAMGALSRLATSGSASMSSLANAVGGLIPNIGFLATGIIGGAAAVAGMLEVVGRLNDGLAKMGVNAARAGLDVERFQELQFGALANGLNNKDFASGAENMAARLSDASRNANDLSRLLDANNVKFKNANGLLIDTNQLFDIARDLIHRGGTEMDKIKIAEMLGLTKDWVPLLDRSSQSFAAIGREANALGLIIGRDVIDRASEFEREWQKSSAVFSTWVKSQLLDLMPVIDDLIAGAQRLTRDIQAAKQTPQGQEVTQRGRRASYIMTSPEFDDDGYAARTIVAKRALEGTLQEETKNLIDQKIAAADTAEMWNNIAAGWENAAAASKKLNAATANDNAPGGPRSIIPAKDAGKDSLDRQIDQITRHTAVMNADAAAVGATAGQHEYLRTQALLLEAAQRANTPVTEELAAKFEKLSQNAKAAADNLARARLNSNIQFDRDQLGRNDVDQKVASQLRSAGLPVDLNSAEAAQLRLNEQLKIGRDLAGDFASGFAKDMAHGASAADAMGNALQRLADKLIDMAVNNLVANAFGGSSGGLASILGFGGGGAAPTSVNYGDGILRPMFHDGGLVGVGGSTKGGVSWGYYQDAPRYHLGIDEVPAVLKTGERVLNRQEAASYNGTSRGSAVSVTYAPSYNVQGSGPEIDKLREEIANDRALAPQRIIATVQDAQKRRVIA